MKKLNKQLFKLLKLHSPSGKEWGVVSYLLPILRDVLDWVTLDKYGNIIGYKVYGKSDYQVLLSAHMDTVANSQPDPKWRKNKTEIYNATGKGALGGDDKCGLAAHLEIIRQLNKGTEFQGTLKVCFSREEETGCVGASQAVNLNPDFFKDVDASIIIDRKGSDNIVTGCWSEQFCHENYGQFWKDMSGLVGFKAVVQDGSISDTMVFSEKGINGVNLSAGYYNAHTKDEYIKIDELYRTVNWVVTAFDNFEKYGKFPSFEYMPAEKQWSTQYWQGGSKWSTCTTGKWEDEYCDYCGFVYPVDELKIEQDGCHICLECQNEQSLVECAYCSDYVNILDCLDINGQTVCCACVEDIKGIFTEEQEKEVI